MRPIRAVIYGVGSMGALIAPMLLGKGVEIVGAIARNPGKVGRDLAEVAGLEAAMGVIVDDDAARVLGTSGADIAVVSVGSLVGAMYDHFRVCLENGVNVLTIEEESLYPWLTSASLSAQLDALAKRHGVTLTGSGIQDVYWVKLVSVVIGSMLQLERVAGRAQWNIDDFGPEVAREFRVGGTREDLQQAASVDGWYSPTVRNTLDALAAEVGLTVERSHARVTPVIAAADVRSKSLAQVIPAGRVSGLVEAVRIETREGPTLEFEMTGRVYDQPSDADTSEWLIRGEPGEVKLANAGYSTRLLTGSVVANRIPDVLNAEPGLVTIDRLPPARYRPLPLGNYVRR